MSVFLANWTVFLTRLVGRADRPLHIHRLNPSQNLEETMGALSRLVEEGKIDGIELCEVGTATQRHAKDRIFPLVARRRAKIPPACRELGMGFVPYSPLGRGFLAGGPV